MKDPMRFMCMVFMFLLLPVFPSPAVEPPNGPVLRLDIETHTGRITKISVDAQSRYLATASFDKTVRIWDSRTGKPVRVLRPPIGDDQEGQLYAVAVSPDGQTVACAGYTGVEWQDRAIYLFDVRTGKMKHRITGLTETVLELVYSRDSKYFAVLEPSRYGLHLYRTSDYKPVAHDYRYEDRSFGADFSPTRTQKDIPRLVTSSWDGYIRLYEIKPNGTLSSPLKLIEKRRPASRKKPHTVRFSPDGSMVAVGFYDSPKVDILSGKDLSYLYSPDTTGVNDGNLQCVAWSQDGKFLYAGGRWGELLGQNFVRKWSEGGRGKYTDISAAESTVTGIVPLLTGGIALGTYAGSIGIFDAQDNRITDRSPPLACFRGLQVSQDGRTIRFSYDRDGRFPHDIFAHQSHTSARHAQYQVGKTLHACPLGREYRDD